MPENAQNKATPAHAGAFRTWFFTLTISFGLLAAAYGLAYVNNGHHAALDSSITARAAAAKN